MHTAHRHDSKFDFSGALCAYGRKPKILTIKMLQFKYIGRFGVVAFSYNLYKYTDFNFFCFFYLFLSLYLLLLLLFSAYLSLVFVYTDGVLSEWSPYGFIGLFACLNSNSNNNKTVPIKIGLKT